MLEIETEGVPGFLGERWEKYGSQPWVLVVTPNYPWWYFNEDMRYAIQVYFANSFYGSTMWGVNSDGMQHIYSIRATFRHKSDALQEARSLFANHWGVKNF